MFRRERNWGSKRNRGLCLHLCICVCLSSPSSVLPPEEKSDISLGLFSPAFSSISFTSLCCSCSIAPRHFSSRIFHFVSCCHLPHPSPSHILFFLLSESLFLSSLPPLSHTTNIEILPFLVKFSNKFSWRPHGGWPSSSCQTNCLTYNLPQVERFLQISCFTSSLLSHSPYHLFITLSILSFYSISSSSPTLQPCKKSLTFTMLAFG